ncbi:MAG: hypothetical protein KF699_09240 [Phycisphaeraceae bacterium]|nr:hypothetical protein [Phycisphaeraceae bacterium]
MLPGPDDDAIIDVAAGPTITITQTTTVRSLMSERGISHTAGTLTLNEASEFRAGYTLGSATLTGAGDLTFNGVVTWDGGTITGTGLATFASTAVVALSGLSRTLGRDLNSFGIVNWSSGDVQLLTGVEFTNKAGGQFNVSSSLTRQLNTNGATVTASFINEGTFTKSGAGQLRLNEHNLAVLHIVNRGVINMDEGTIEFGWNGSPAVFTNEAAGIVNVNAGTITARNAADSNAGLIDIDAGAFFRLEGGSTHAAGSVIQGAGDLLFVGGTHTFAAGSFVFDCQVAVSAILTGLGDLTFTGAVTWDNWATGNGTLTFASTATVNHIRGGYHRNTDNFGVFLWNNNDIELLGGRTFTNHVGAHFEFAVPLPRPHSYI